MDVISSFEYALTGQIQGDATASVLQWEEHFYRLGCEQLWLLTGERGRKFETSSTKDT